MFTLKNSWICMDGRPVLSMERGNVLFSSGCGNHEVRCIRDGHVRPRGRARFVRYRVASHTVRPDEVRVLLESAGHPTGALLTLTGVADGCLMRVEGLPWDHNLVMFQIGIGAQEKVLACGDLYRNGQADVHKDALGSGQHFFWADARSPFPVNGFYTDKGFALSVEGDVLMKIGVRPAIRTEGTTHHMDVTLWGTGTAIHLSVSEDAATARNALRNRTAVRQQLPDPFASGPLLVSAQGGEKAIRTLVSTCQDDAERMDSLRALVLEDWQGMRKTLIGGMPDCTWEADREQYPQLAALITALREQHVVCALPVLPCVDLDTEMFREAAVRSHCLVGPKGHIWEDKRRENAAAWLDLTRDRTLEWVAEQLTTLVDKTDTRVIVARLDLPFPCEASGVGGEAATLRNHWAARWYRVCRDALAPREDVLVLPDLPTARPSARTHASGGHRTGKAANRE